jgi:acetyl-CoA acetyltransferase
MCSPIGDGAAAVILVSEAKARQLGITRPVRVVSTVLVSGWDHGMDEDGAGDVSSRQVYEEAGVAPADIDIIELHDASAPGEILAYEYLGICPKGEGGRLVQDGVTKLGGRQPVNTSGGLLRKGHPVGATGTAQIVELTEQLLGRSGPRQVQGARLALAQNGGGNIGVDVAAMCVSVLKI